MDTEQTTVQRKCSSNKPGRLSLCGCFCCDIRFILEMNLCCLPGMPVMI